MVVEPFEFSVGSERQPDRHHPIPLLESTVTAFIGRTERGPTNEPVAIHSFDEFRRVFGGHGTFSFVSHAVQHYFLHGGEKALVVRVANRATRGRIDLPARGECLSLQALQPGTRELLRVSVDYDGVESDERFNLVIQRLSRPGAGFIEDQELFLGLSVSPTDDRCVVEALQASELVRLGGPLPASRPDATCAAHPGQAIPYLYMTALGSDGDELTDYDVVGSNSESTGLFALDRVERIDLLCIPPPPGRELGTTTFLAAERYCRRRRAMLVWDPPYAWRSADTALLGMRSSAQTSCNALTSFPRLTVRGDLERFPDGLPACGAVAGMLARADRGGSWRPLQGADAAVKGGLRPLVQVDAREATRLQRAGMNVLHRSETGHYALHGNVSLAGSGVVAPAWRRLDRARLALFILGSIERSTSWISASVHDPELGSKLECQVADFLAALHRHGALAGGRPGQAFFARVVAPVADARPCLSLLFGFALEAPGDFATYELRCTEVGIVIRSVSSHDVEQHAG